MRRSLLLAFLVACGPSSPGVEAPTNTTAGSVDAPPHVDETKLGALVLVPSVGESSITYAPHSDTFAFDSNKLAKAGSAWTLVGTGGERVDVTAGKEANLAYGCDNNTLEGVPLAAAGTPKRLPAGVAWMLPANAPWKITALPIERGAHEKVRETYRVGELTLTLERTQPSKGVAMIASHGTKVEIESFERQLMDGAEPALATIDFSDPDMRLQIPVPVAAWALSASGPYLVVMHTQGFEGASLETFLVETRPDQPRATKIESMAVYLYQCAF